MAGRLIVLTLLVAVCGIANCPSPAQSAACHLAGRDFEPSEGCSAEQRELVEKFKAGDTAAEQALREQIEWFRISTDIPLPDTREQQPRRASSSTSESQSESSGQRAPERLSRQPERVRTTVMGMDDSHAEAAQRKTSTFVETIRTLRRDFCEALETAEFDVQVIYVPELRGTVVSITSKGLTSPPLRPYPGGRYLSTTCLSLVATAAFRTWSPRGVLFNQTLDEAVLSFEFAHISRLEGAAPTTLLLETKDGQYGVPLYKQTFQTVKLEYPGVRPDGLKNGSARLRDVVGEELEQ